MNLTTRVPPCAEQHDPPSVIFEGERLCQRGQTRHPSAACGALQQRLDCCSAMEKHGGAAKRHTQDTHAAPTNQLELALPTPDRRRRRVAAQMTHSASRLLRLAASSLHETVTDDAENLSHAAKLMTTRQQAQILDRFPHSSSLVDGAPAPHDAEQAPVSTLCSGSVWTISIKNTHGSTGMIF